MTAAHRLTKREEEGKKMVILKCLPPPSPQEAPRAASDSAFNPTID